MIQNSPQTAFSHFEMDKMTEEKRKLSEVLKCSSVFLDLQDKSIMMNVLNVFLNVFCNVFCDYVQC